jgi:hypothetical protein
MYDDELNPEFIEKINKIKKEESIKVDDFEKKYNLDEDELELIEETIKDIKKSREEYKKGNVYSLKDIKESNKIK